MKRSADVLTSHHSHIIRTSRLEFFGHIACADPSMNHSRALRTCVAPLPMFGTTNQADRVTPGSGPLNLI